MKKIFVTWGFVFVLAALCLNAAVAQHSDPRAVVSGFYTWYLKNLSKPREKVLPLHKADFEPELYRMIIRGCQPISPKEGNVVLDFDPFIDAQIYGESFKMDATQMSGNSAKIPVNVKLERSNQYTHVVVSLRKNSAGAWQIDNIIYPKSKFDLRSFLKKNLK